MAKRSAHKVRRKVLIKDRTYRYGGRFYKGIDLVDYLFLSGEKIEDIARILNVEEAPFVEEYGSRLEDLEKIHKGLLVKSVFDKAFSGDSSTINMLLSKYQWLDKSDAQSNNLFGLLKSLLIEESDKK